MTALKRWFEYRPPAAGVEIVDETVTFPRVFPFDVLFPLEFSEPEINEWIGAHDGKWDKAEFLFDKMKENGGSIP